MNNQDIDKNIIKEFITDSKTDDITLKIFLGLYSNYFKLQNVLVEDNIIKLKEYEDEIYTIENEILTDRNRIKIELDRIKDELLIENKSDINRYVKPQIEEIEQLLLLNDELFKELINYIKKKIVKLQILLGLDITFFQSSYELFTNEYAQIEEKNKEKIR